MPKIDDLACYELNPELYQDKLNFFKELIDILHEEIDEYCKQTNTDDDFELPW